MPQPIDLNTELARSTAAQRMMEQADRASLTALQRQAQQAQDDQVRAETVVDEPPQGRQESGITDRRDGRSGAQRQSKRKAQSVESDTAVEQNAGELEVIAVAEEVHRLDVQV